MKHIHHNIHSVTLEFTSWERSGAGCVSSNSAIKTSKQLLQQKLNNGNFILLFFLLKVIKLIVYFPCVWFWTGGIFESNFFVSIFTRCLEGKKWLIFWMYSGQRRACNLQKSFFFFHLPKRKQFGSAVRSCLLKIAPSKTVNSLSY